jgi:hypothetical protein
MGLETFTGWIKDLVSTNPAGTDTKSEGDDHLRGIKQTLKQQFSGFTGEAVTVTEAQLNDAGKYSGSLWRRNLLINGGFDIWQRGTSQTASGYGSVDRWVASGVGTTKTASKQLFTLGQTDVPGNPEAFYRHVVSSVAGAGNYCLTDQHIEGVSTGSGQTVTLSFYAKADAPKNIAIELAQNFGGGSPSAAVTGIGSQKIALTTSWARYTATISVPSIAGKTLGSTNGDLEVIFWFDAGSNWNSRTSSLGQQSGTFDIANVQLEIGAVATPFERLPIGETLALCQRYYATGTARFDGYAVTGANVSTRVAYPVTMRGIPTVTPTNVSVSGFSATVQGASSTVDGVSLYHSATATGGGNFVDTWTADSEL